MSNMDWGKLLRESKPEVALPRNQIPADACTIKEIVAKSQLSLDVVTNQVAQLHRAGELSRLKGPRGAYYYFRNSK